MQRKGLVLAMKKLLHEMFEEKANEYASNIAISFNDENYTYKELNEFSNRLARYMIDKGVGKESQVGVFINRSFNMIACMIAILKVGATYVPLDPKQVKNRINLIVEASNIKYLVSDYETRDTINNIENEICIDTISKELDKYDGANLNIDIDDNNLAYIIFTSGSTGKPKGVKIMHKNVVHFINEMSKVLNVSSIDKVLAVTTIAFDISVLEIFLTLSKGACVILADYMTTINSYMLSKLIKSKEPTIIQATPSTFYMLLDSDWTGNNNLQILCGGEAWEMSLANRLFDKCKKLYNVYGPTETTVWVSIGQVKKGDEYISLGKVLDGTNMYILDDNFNEVADFNEGEIFIGGAQVGLGYFNDDKKTDSVFIKSSKYNNEILYKTGDIVKRNDKGEIIYIQRKDYQVKIRGFRIELGDIESNALMIENVKQAAAVVKEHNGDKIIALYLVVEGKLDNKEILDKLRDSLPYYMVPQIIEIIDEMPMNASRKIDRKFLEEKPYEIDNISRECVLPSTPLEKEMVDICKDLLGIEQVSITDNFLEIGGHSLLLNKLIDRLRDRLEIDITVLDILANDLSIIGMVKSTEDYMLNQIDSDMLDMLKGMTEEEIEIFLNENDL